MTLITLTELANKSFHLGHNLEQWNPKTTKFIYKIVNKTCLIDLIQTAQYLSKSYSYFYIAGQFKQNILFIGSTPLGATLIKQAAQTSENFYYNRSWIAGTLTNWKMIQSRLILLLWVSKILKLINTSNSTFKVSSTTYSTFYKIYKQLSVKLSGLIGLVEIPEILFILDPKYEKIAFKEAIKLNKIIISIVDSNINPDHILIPIPGNDDNFQVLDLTLKLLAAGYVHGAYYN